MKTVLLACSDNGRDTVTELPSVLKRAGLNVTLMSGKESRRYIGSFYDRWIESSENAYMIIRQIAELFKKNPACFDWVILGDDQLLRALSDSDITPELKTRIGPISNMEYLDVLGSKTEGALFAAGTGVLTPPFKTCGNFDEIAAAAHAIGFPVMLKVDRSGGGEGVFECHDDTDIRRHHERLSGHRILVEKKICGNVISVEPLYIQSRLLAYCYSESQLVYGSTGVSMRRRFKPCPSIIKTLEAIGQNLGLSGFCSFSFMHEPESNRHYLIELDLRPNAWVAYGRFSGIDFSQALKTHIEAPHAANHDIHKGGQEKTISICYREIPHFLRRSNLKGLIYWLCNANNCWRTVPLYDLRFLLFRVAGVFSLAVQRFRKNPVKPEELPQGST